MSSYFYDFHLHSCLSPCGDEDMTPNNIIGMAGLLGLEIIALTDHNSVRNCRAAVAVGQANGIVVVPGMELTTAEEIHVVTLFPDCDRAEAFGDYVTAVLPPIPNRPDIFGHQYIRDAEDEINGEEEIFLLSATSVSIEDVLPLCQEYGGICYPAHIDRSSFSVFSALGTFPEHIGFRFAELSQKASDSFCAENGVPDTVEIIRSSDAHRLEDMQDAAHTLELSACTPEAVIQYFSDR